METNHTRTKTQILNSKGVITTNFRENLIGVFEAMEEYANEKNKEMEANAKLIATASELLEVLRQFIDITASVKGIDITRNKAIKLIKKATE